VIDPFDLLDLFDLPPGPVDIYQSNKIDKVAALEADSFRRLTHTQDRVRDLEQRYERMRLVTAALWQLLKAHTGLTDADLKQYIEKVDLADGKLDGKIARKGGAMDCPHCTRRILKTAVVCPWCSKRLATGDAFEAT
jgi:formate-dependent nitrite reductase cytochrome c552 subunit